MKYLTILFLTISLSLWAQPSEEQGGKKQTFKVDKGGNLDVSVNVGNIRIITWERNEVQLNAIGVYDEDANNVKATQSGNTIRISYDEGWGNSDDITFEVSVPAQFNVSMRTSGGDLEVRGTLKGELKGATSGGDIKLGNVAGKVDISTSGGDIKAGNIESSVVFNTSGGDISIGTVTGEADIKTMGGDISVLDVGKKLYAKTYGGDISIGNIGGNADVSTYGGSIIVKNVSGSATISTSGGDIELNSASGTVKAKTSGGDVRLQKISGSVDASTSSGEVNVNLIPGGKGKSRISSSNGQITLVIPENAKATIEARIKVRGSWRHNSDENQIRSDFKSQTYEKDSGNKMIRATYILNGGGETITLDAVNSDIEIKKSY